MWSTNRRPLPAALRVLLVTDGRGDLPRLDNLVSAALEGGIRAVMIREHGLSTRAIAKLCERLMPSFTALDGVLLVNGHADIAAAGLAHGVHCNARSLHPAQVRAFLPETVLVGYSAHSPAELDLAADAGCDYAALSPVFPMESKPGVESMGPVLATEWTAHARLPVLWLGGIDCERARGIRGRGPSGVAAMSALCAGVDVRESCSAFVRAFSGGTG